MSFKPKKYTNRTITSPLILNPDGRVAQGEWSENTFSVLPPRDSMAESRRSRAWRMRMRQREETSNTSQADSQNSSIQDLLEKYGRKSRETSLVGASNGELDETASLDRRRSSRDQSPSITQLLKRYGSPSVSSQRNSPSVEPRPASVVNGSAATSSTDHKHSISDRRSVDSQESDRKESARCSRPSPDYSTDSHPEAKRCLMSPKLSGSNIQVKWQIHSQLKSSPPLYTNGAKKTHISVFASNQPLTGMPVGGSNSRSGRLARISQSNIRPFGSNSGKTNSMGPGGQPLAGAEPTSPTKKDSKHRFEITKKLGSGTYGKVSLAFDHKFDREVAVKLIKKSAIENKADLVRIRREIRIMSALNHPNIIQIYEVFENKDKIILVMEYASGGELYDYVSRHGSLPENEARRIFRQITSAVLYCHKHQVAHRDLKLENILLDHENSAKIADFGLSNYFSDKGLLSTFCGSPLYASPEIINGTPYKGPEVDCWSLGILLYTLVYGSMPFDGRDFNRMVRQIKRGAYYEPETPSTASMLIRNMLRVNPERRADIFEIASHWWLNLEENMPVIQELPENQMIDHTPLTERPETMVVQDLNDEADVFMEFGHLSQETRKKIEDFRRRRKEAEEYNENSPVKPPKSRKTDGQPQEEMRMADKSLRETKQNEKVIDTNDPLERLRQIETRLGGKPRLPNVPVTAPPDKEVPGPKSPLKKEPQTPTGKKAAEKRTSPEQPEDPRAAREQAATGAAASEVRAPTFVPVSGGSSESSHRNSIRTPMSASAYRMETDTLNMLMNQVLEQMDKGGVSLNLIARIKSHPLYDARPMVKELLESIIAAQPAEVQQQAHKVIDQDLTLRRNESKTTGGKGRKEDEEKRQTMGRRPWHSVEVGFDPDEDQSEHMDQSIMSTATEHTVADTSFEDSDDQKEKTPTTTWQPQKAAAPKAKPPPPSPLAPIVKKEELVESDEEEEEYTDSEMEELAQVVEKVAEKVPDVKEPEPEVKAPLAAPESSTSTSTTGPVEPPPDPSASPRFLDAFDRGLIKRQSKGKYQHNRVDMYGRGVSTECESPTLPRRLHGGPQPTAEQSPFLFDKAKEIIMHYPKEPDMSSLDPEAIRKKKIEKLKEKMTAPVEKKKEYVGSVPPRTPPPIFVKSEGEESDEEEEEEEEDEEEDLPLPIPRFQVNGEKQPELALKNGEVKRTAVTVAEIQGRGRRQTQSSVESLASSTHTTKTRPTTTYAESSSRKASTSTTATHHSDVHASLLPVTNNKPANAKYLVTVAELKMHPTSNTNQTSQVAASKAALERKIAEKESQLAAEHHLHTTNHLTDSGSGRGESPNVPSESSTAAGKDKDKESWESAAAFIRRKNRERRYRNRTIGTADEALRALERPSVEHIYTDLDHPAARALSPFTTDNHYGHDTASSGMSYIRPRLHEESYRSDYSMYPVRDERGRSYSIRETTPELEARYGVDRHGGASPSYTRKFDHDQNNWAHEPRRFEVYKTRAERDAERNTLHSAITTTSYRTPTSYYSSTNDRIGAVPSYRNEYNPARNDVSYRRSQYETDRALTPGTADAYMNISGSSGHSTDLHTRLRPTARRVASALTEADRRAYNRSRSMDRKQSELELSSDMRNRLTTPETSIPDYSYVNYHDTSGHGRKSQSRELGNGVIGSTQIKGILKNKASADVEPRGADKGRASNDSTGGVKSVIDRLKRHLSLEKSISPTRHLGREERELSPRKKRSLLSSLNRRKTSEVRLGADGKLITSNGYDDSSYKRPSSPIDRIKSLFKKTDTGSSQHTSGGTSDYMSRLYSGQSNVASTAARERDTYVPQYRRYPGASRDPSSLTNRYSYTPGMESQRRYWHDEL